MRKTIILHIIDTLGVGGAERILVGVVKGLPQYQHHVIYLAGPDELLKELPAECQVKKLDFHSKWDILRCAFQLRSYIKRNSINIVHSHLFMSTIIARIGCPSDVKLFSSMHSMPSQNYFATRLRRLAEKITYRRRHHIVAVSEVVMSDYDKCIGIKGPFDILSNYVESHFVRNTYKQMSFNGVFRMIAVGSLKEAKNYLFLLESFKKLPDTIQLDIYGDGPMKEEMQEFIWKNQLNNVRLCGVKKDIWNILPDYDAFVMSSVFEGQPVALLEAMSCGMPAILSDIPVLREASGNQAVFFSLDDISDFVNKVTAIANHTVNLDVYAKAGFEIAQKLFDKATYLASLDRLYSGCNAYQREFDKPFPSVKIFTSRMPAQAS